MSAAESWFPALVLHFPGQIRESLLAQMVLGTGILSKSKRNEEIKGSAKDQPSYRMIQSIDAEALIKQAVRAYQETGAPSAGTSARDGAIASIQRA
jgi:hypothetical protein